MRRRRISLSGSNSGSYSKTYIAQDQLSDRTESPAIRTCDVDGKAEPEAVSRYEDITRGIWRIHNEIRWIRVALIEQLWAK